MGLDMYAWAVPEDWAVDDETILKEGEGTRPEGEDGRLNEIFYWRKHHDLHGWVENLYRDRGGAAKSFNCVQVRLYPHNLDRLEVDIRASMLPQTSGFFFGNNPPDEDSIQHDLEFISKARESIADGHAVYYDSWW